VVLQLEKPVLALAFHPGGKMLASTCHDEKFIALWELSATPTKMDMSIALDTPGLALSFTADGKLLACGTIGQRVVVFDLSGPKPSERGFVTTGSAVHSAAFSPDGKRLAFVGFGTALWLGDGSGPKPKKLTDLRHRAKIVACGFAPDSQTLVTADADHWVTVWDAVSGNKLREFQTNDDIVRLAVAADSRHLAAANTNGTVSVFRLGSPPAVPAQ
jgi:WD40 repeat protein